MSDRHPKWQRVEPGTVIPAGQPYRLEYDRDVVRRSCLPASDTKAVEGIGANVDWPVSDREGVVTFVDSSWRPPLVLPTEPTWGIAVAGDGGALRRELGRWLLSDNGDRLNLHESEHRFMLRHVVLDFIPLTEEQVQRIENAQ